MISNTTSKRETKVNHIWQTPSAAKTPVSRQQVRTGFKSSLVPEIQNIKNELLLSLPRETFAQLQPEMKTVSFERGQTIYDIGNSFDFVYFANNLVASRLALMEDGAMIEVGVIGREGLLGIAALIGANMANNVTIAETAGTATRIKTSVLRDAFRRDFKLQTLLLGYYNDFLTQISQRAACRCRHSVAQQLCTWLLQIHDRTQKDDLTLTQETISQRLGARRASITVAINNLEKNNLLVCRRGHITICNREGLEIEACECYSLLNNIVTSTFDSKFLQ
ncbi:MAG: Crp/Fnr family transcriptional regulator [Pyrinomonadaceae bacterium]|nr:Crp/Fnr family transcriptional regulator [Pyrinomonadaceae bacterium]